MLSFRSPDEPALRARRSVPERVRQGGGWPRSRVEPSPYLETWRDALIVQHYPPRGSSLSVISLSTALFIVGLACVVTAIIVGLSISGREPSGTMAFWRPSALALAGAVLVLGGLWRERSEAPRADVARELRANEAEIQMFEKLLVLNREQREQLVLATAQLQATLDSGIGTPEARAAGNRAIEESMDGIQKSHQDDDLAARELQRLRDRNQTLLRSSDAAR